MSELNYYLSIGKKQPFSLNPVDSDFMANATGISHLIGTLVMRSSAGRYEPYLAQSWLASDDFSKWSFALHGNLECEDGTPIGPALFKFSLEKVIKIYYEKRPSLPIIEDLVGYADFIGGKSSHISGISAAGSVISFEFKKPIRSGVLEFLSMPYYGFFAPNNFDATSKWKNSNEIISSASYRLGSISEDKSVLTIVKRNNWPTHLEGSPAKVHIRQVDQTEAFASSLPNKVVTIKANSSIPEEFKNNLNQVKAVPEILVALVLSPLKDGPFKSINNRRVFLQRLREQQKLVAPENKDISTDPYFYPQFKTPELVNLGENLSTYEIISNRKPITVYLGRADENEPYLKSLIEGALAGHGLTFEYLHVDQTQKDWIKRHTSNDAYDIRIAAVSIGGGFQHWLTKMMFCSNLGISFTDPSGRICKLVEAHEGANWNINQFANEFNRVLTEDASVIPVIHTGVVWYLDKSIEAPMAPTSLVPRFDLFRITQ